MSEVHPMQRIDALSEHWANYVSLTLAADAAGITYRQADYWATSGFLEVVTANAGNKVNGRARATCVWPEEHEANPGSGYLRMLHKEEARVLVLMAQLVRMKVLPVAASFMAHQLVNTGIYFSEDIAIHWVGREDA